MFRTLVLAAGLALTAPVPALACGGAPCSKACKMKPQSDHEVALAKVEAADGTKVELDIAGMHCGSCSTKVIAALEGLDGVAAAAVSHETGKGRVAFDSAKADTDAMLTAIKALGFEATLTEAS